MAVSRLIGSETNNWLLSTGQVTDLIQGAQMAANRRSVSQTLRGSRGRGVTAHIHTGSVVGSGQDFHSQNVHTPFPLVFHQSRDITQWSKSSGDTTDSTPTFSASVAVSNVKSHKCCRVSRRRISVCHGDDVNRSRTFPTSDQTERTTPTDGRGATRVSSQLCPSLR